MGLHDYRRGLRTERMGRVAYGPMLSLQEARHERVVAGEIDDTLFLVEHDPVITTGKNTGDGSVLTPAQDLRRSGIEFFNTGRGGDVTYHGPGQVVGYPIVALQEGEQDVKRYVWLLEELMIRTAKDFGIAANRIEGLRGIWVGDEKLAAIGVRISRWTTMHGFAFNVCPNLKDFENIIPCGIRDRGVTSLEKLLPDCPNIEDVEDRLVFHAGVLLDRDVYEAKPTQIPHVAYGAVA